MKTLGISFLLAAAWLPLHTRAADHVLPYSAFGPQVIAHELIGMEWWQWDNHGDSRPREYPIKVVVYWDQTLEETQKRFPVEREKEKDFRYVEYAPAVKHMEKAAKEMEAATPDSGAIRNSAKEIREALKALRAAHEKANAGKSDGSRSSDEKAGKP